MKMRHYGIILIAVVIVAAGIGASTLITASNDDPGKLKVVATFYPLGYMAEAIGGDDIEVSTLIPYNTEVHSWQPSASDIILADSADVFLYNGAGLDPWVEDDLLPAIDTGSTYIIKTTEGLDLLDIGSHEHDEGMEEDHDHITDPHTWVSPHMAMQQAQAIHNALVEADAHNASRYSERLSHLNSTLSELDQRYSDELEDRQWDSFFVTHAAYGYICDRYEIVQEAIIGIDADEQPSSSTIADLADLMIDEGIYTIFLNPVFSDEYARTLELEVESKTGEDVVVLELYIMTGPMDGMDLLEQMEANLQNLKAGLGATAAS